MKKLALLTMMVLGSTGIASADSFRISGSARGSVSFGTPVRYTQPVRYQQPVYQQPVYQSSSGWMSSSSNTIPPQVITVRDRHTNQSWEVTPCHDANFNVSGFYTGAAGNVELTQRGNRIFGTFAGGGQMQGYIQNGRITYTWTQGTSSGQGFWYVDGRGQLIGTWGHDSSDSDGNWNLRLAAR